MGIAISINPGQPAQSDHVRNVSLLADFLCIIPLPNNKILPWSKLKAFADFEVDIVKMMIIHLDRVENAVGKGENAGYQHFLLFPLCFPNLSSLGLLKVGDYEVKS